jgi:hypothetical protein
MGGPQLRLIQECRRRAAAARDLRLCSAWIGIFLQISNALNETAKAIGDLEWAPRDAALPVGLRLPQLPSLPKEGEAPSPENPKTTPSGISSRINGLTHRRSPVRRRVKSKGGAPRGNRNAQKAGCHTLALREFHRALAVYVRTLKAELSPLSAVLPRRPKRVFYLVTRPERCYVRTRRGSTGRPQHQLNLPLEGGAKNVGEAKDFSGRDRSSKKHLSPKFARPRQARGREFRPSLKGRVCPRSSAIIPRHHPSGVIRLRACKRIGGTRRRRGMMINTRRLYLGVTLLAFWTGGSAAAGPVVFPLKRSANNRCAMVRVDPQQF